jgi:hypothetical protein
MQCCFEPLFKAGALFKIELVLITGPLAMIVVKKVVLAP